MNKTKKRTGSKPWVSEEDRRIAVTMRLPSALVLRIKKEKMQMGRLVESALNHYLLDARKKNEL